MTHARTLTASFFRALPRLILVALFAFAAVDKVTHFRGFVTAVGSYNLLPQTLEFAAAVFFIMAEFAIAAGLLLSRRWRRAASLAAVLLLTLFTTVYLAARPAWVCGCWFTLTLSSGGSLHILQNIVFIGLAALTYLDNRSSPVGPEVSSASYLSRHSTATQNRATEDLGTFEEPTLAERR